MFTCKFCNKTFQKKQALAGHETSCRKNPKFQQTMEHIRNSHNKFYGKTERDIICPKCGTPHKQIMTQREFQKGRYKKYCCSQCAHSHNVTQEQKEKTRNTLKQTLSKKSRKLYTCKACRKDLH